MNDWENRKTRSPLEWGAAAPTAERGRKEAGWTCPADLGGSRGERVMSTHLKCLVGHDWDGCRCSRCGHTRDEQHAWEGCVCARCGSYRDADHKWEPIDCRLECRICGRLGDESHDWDGCICRRCRANRHHWCHGCCTVCGFICSHESVTDCLEDSGCEETFHGSVLRVCCACSEVLEVVWKK